MESIFSELLLRWYLEEGRALPWRMDNNPYHIWVSEVILQQTRIAQGYDYYVRFIRHFPTVERLAAAGEDEVMRLWQGLGYYSRARNMHLAAKEIARQGSFPVTYEEVRSLKGVGDYTAAAICSFAYNMPRPAVDGNVARVLSRWLGIAFSFYTATGKRELTEAAYRLMDKERPALFNQALMELGELICLPAGVKCAVCPLRESCKALLNGWVESLPVKREKACRTNRYFHYLLVWANGELLIAKRKANDIWKDLYELPLIESDGALSEEEFCALPELRRWLGEGEEEILSLRCLCKGKKHLLTHRVIYIDFYELVLPAGKISRRLTENFLKIPVSRLGEFAFPRPVASLFEKIIPNI